MRVLNFGSLNIDTVYTVEHFVKAGETISSLDYKVFCGGKGLNQSIALKRAGVEHLYHAGKIAKDGKMLLETLEKDNIDAQFVSREGTYTGHAIIQVEESGQNSIILSPGANGEVTTGEACAVLTHFEKGDKILLQNEVSSLGYIMKKAHERGISIFLNPSPITDSLLQCPLELVELFVMNELEAEEISGQKDVDKAIEAIHTKYPNSKVVITLGRFGVKYFDGQRTYFHSAFNVKAVDTTAAGDTFTGFFIEGYLAGNKPEEILENASKAAAIAVMSKGASTSIPTKAIVGATTLELSKETL